MKLSFDTNGNEKQKECAKYWIDDETEEIWYGGAKGGGKSFLGCSLIFGDAFIYPGTHYFIARKKLNDLRRFTIPSIHEVFNIWGLSEKYYNYNGQDNFFQLYNGSKVFLLDAKWMPSDPEYQRFGSMQMTRGWIEEAGEFEEKSYSNLAISIGRWKNDLYNLTGKLLSTMNPSKNFVKRKVYNPYKSGRLEKRVKFIQAFPQDNKMLDAGYLDRLRNTLTKNERERLLNGNWEYDDDPTALIDYDDIMAIFENDHAPIGKKYITADIARLGSDKAIILVWSGFKVIDCVVFDKSKTTQIQDAINTLRYKYGIPKKNCIADEDGVGGGVVDNCGILGFVNNSSPFPEIISGEASDKPNYQNLQTQCCYHLAKRVNSHELYIQTELQEHHKDEIVEDLEQLKTYELDKDRKLRILPKEKVKDNIGRSPDWRDVLMMREYFELMPKRA